mgnify:FL=1
MPLMPDGSWVPNRHGHYFDARTSTGAEETMDALLWAGLVRKDIGSDGTEWFLKPDGGFYDGEAIDWQTIEDAIERFEEPPF